MTDDLGMNALGGSLADRTRAAHAAGCDIALHCSGFVKDPDLILAEMREVGEASPELSGVALSRATEAEAATTHATEFDAEAGWARLRALVPSPGVAA
jgi:beta-N-acetylhexosaminidase